MNDEIAIQQTLNRYSEGASRADWAQVMGTFTADATWEIAGIGARYQDHAVIQKVMAAFVGQYYMEREPPPVVLRCHCLVHA